MRGAWACPDIGRDKPAGMYLPVPGSNEQFPDCPAAYLRTASDVSQLVARGRKNVFAEHLIDGAIHPATIVSEAAFEVKNGARNVETLSPKVVSLVHVYLREENARDAYASEQARAKRG